MDNQQNIITELQKAWLAGFIDGEGNIGLHKIRRVSLTANDNYQVRIQITNTNKQVLELIQSWYGGSLYCRPKDNIKHKPEYRWSAENKLLVKQVLLDVFPHLTIKKRQAEVLLQFISENPLLRGAGFKHKLSEETILKRQPLVEEIYRLNQRGMVYA